MTKWSNEGKFLGSWGNQGDQRGEFRIPHGLNIDSEGYIWLTDHQTHQVTKHKQNGECVMELGEFGFANFTLTTDVVMEFISIFQKQNLQEKQNLCRA